MDKPSYFAATPIAPPKMSVNACDNTQTQVVLFVQISSCECLKRKVLPAPRVTYEWLHHETWTKKRTRTCLPHFFTAVLRRVVPFSSQEKKLGCRVQSPAGDANAAAPSSPEGASVRTARSHLKSARSRKSCTCSATRCDLEQRGSRDMPPAGPRCEPSLDRDCSTIPQVSA